MQIQGKVVVVTGAARGIGAALCRRFQAAGAKAIVVSDIDAAGTEAVAKEIGGLAFPANAANEGEVQELVAKATGAFGQIDIFCSNAGIIVDGGIEVPDSEWQRIFAVNYQAHLYAARAVVPQMLARGGGYLVNTVSAAGLLTQIGSAPYAVTKHAALALAEWLSVTYGDRGIRVSVICPQGVRTDMLLRHEGSFLMEGSVTPEHVAETAMQGIEKEEFLILPHPEVGEYFRRKGADYDRWLRGMRRLQARVLATDGNIKNLEK
jgi:NAD(P)-dependent dehydrogenase (short-subunit alcohol dehydrogenase family)